MNVTQLGRLNSPWASEKPWHLAVEHHCPRCGARWFLESGDMYWVGRTLWSAGGESCISICPTDDCLTKVETVQGGSVGTSDWDGKPLTMSDAVTG